MLKFTKIKLYFSKPNHSYEASNLMSQIASTQLLDIAFQEIFQKHLQRDTLKLKLALDKTFIGKCSKGFYLKLNNIATHPSRQSKIRISFDSCLV